MTFSGRVRLFNDIIGTGYIEPADGSPVLKFSYKDIIKPGFQLVYEGQNVTFSILYTDRGPVAVEIHPDCVD
jgi:cold shock CspA family protein